MEGQNIQLILSEIKQINSKVSQIENKIKTIEDKLAIPQSNPVTKQFVGDVITMHSESEVKTLFNWLSLDNESITLKLLYHPSSGINQDRIDAARCRCLNRNPLLMLIETTDGCKFGGYRNIIHSAKSKIGWDVCLFSLAKKQIHSLELNQKVDLSQDDVTFWLNDVFCLNDNFMFKKSYISTKDHFGSHSTLEEYNDGNDSFTVKELFIYEVKYNN